MRMRSLLSPWIFIVLILAVAASAGAQSLPKPTAEITSFRVQSISLRDVTFLFELTVKNPYPLKLSFSGMTLDFLVEGSKVFSAADKGGFSVGAKGTKASTFSVTMAYADVIKVVKEYSSKDWLNTAVKGVLVIPLPKMPGLPKDVSFKYSLSKRIPAIKPAVAIKSFTVEAPSAAEVSKAVLKAGKKVDPVKAKGVLDDLIKGKKPKYDAIDPSEIDVPLTVSFSLEVRNDARAPIAFPALEYELFVNGESLVKGSSATVATTGSTTTITVKSVFSSKKLSKKVKALFDDRKGTFSVKGKASVKLPDDISKTPIPLAFEEGGAFSL